MKRDMALFSGKYDYAVDSKGRINFKKILKRLSEVERGDANYHLLKQRIKSPKNEKSYNFFYIFTNHSWNKFYEVKQIDSWKTTERLSFLSSLCGEAQMDANERLSIPKEFLNFIKAKKDLILQGDGDKIQVWTKSDYDEFFASDTVDDNSSKWDIFG